MSDKISLIRNLITYLNECTVAYDAGTPKISDKEWDDLYFQLVDLENETGVYLPESPSQSIHFKTVSELLKVEHNHPMLSLEKTKDLSVVESFGKGHLVLAMCKMDGLTCSLTYRNGRLVTAETRGNGLVGEDILHNALVIPSIPKRIKYQDELVVDGEIICTYDDFEEFAKAYKNPRNFASGSIRLLDSKECANRKLTFVAWDVLKGYEDSDYLNYKLDNLVFEHFTVVPYCNGTPEECITQLRQIATDLGYPIDGIVFKYNSVSLGAAMGSTSHHFKNAIAYKFYDEIYASELKDIEWTMGRTGVLTPVAIFDPIEMDGSIVERASLHNISVMQELLHGTPWVGQKVGVFKANMIIPQIYNAEVAFDNSNLNFINIPEVCPVCGGVVMQRTDYDSTVLVCTNPNCEGKLINKLDHFCGKKGLDIKGLSKATLAKLIDLEWVSCYTDLFNLKEHEKEWIKLPGFGVKSVANVLNAIEESKTCDLSQFIAALGIPLIGTSASRELVKYFPTWTDFINAIENGYHFYDINGFGWEIHTALTTFDYSEAKLLAKDYLLINSITQEENEEQLVLEGLTFVITGKVSAFRNRDELKLAIEQLGGKVTGSVSKNTSYLINNDVTSTSSKNRTAQSLGIPIISERTFLETFGLI